VDHNRVDPHRDEPGVAEVGIEVKALGDSSGRNCSGSSSESPLEEEVGPASIVGIVRCAGKVPRVSIRGASEGVFVLGKAEEGISNEGVGVRSFSICDSKPDYVEGNSRDGGVENGLEKNVHRVLGPDSACAEHGKASMHDEDHSSACDKPARVYSIGNLHLPSIDGRDGSSVAGSGIVKVDACIL